MRIIAGKLGGRHFDAPKGHKTHPMSDKIRGGLFNALGDISGLTVLDAFGGSGAISFEAISRGAESALILESDTDASKTISNNIQNLDLAQQIKHTKIFAKSWMNRKKDEQFDLVICDPPYDNIQEKTLEKLANHTKKSGLAIFSLPPHADIRLPKETFELLTEKTYGDATLAFYRKIS